MMSQKKTLCLRSHSIISRILLITFMISGSAILAFSLLFPSLFFQVMKEHLYRQAEDMVLASALRQSYIWQSNFRLRILSSDSEFQKLLVQYYEDDAEADRIREMILSYLPLLQQGTPATSETFYSESAASSAGSILFHDYLVLLEKDGDIFCLPDAVPFAEAIRQKIPWPDSLPAEPIIDHPAPFAVSGSDTEYFATTEVFSLNGRCYAAVRITPLEEILAQFDELNAFGADDYQIYCHDQVLYSHLGEESAILAESYPSDMFSPRQYEVIRYEQAQRIDFSVLVSYQKEDLRVLVSIPKNVILAPYRSVFTYFRLLLFVFALLLFLAFALTLKHALHRLTRLEKVMNRVRGSDYNIEISDPINDEIGSLTQTFQIMLNKLKKDMENQEKMQYTLLVSAIDPHFLYNTLNTITALAELGRSDEIARVNTALIGTLKDRLRMKNYKIFDTVQAEKEALDQYMLIQSYLSSVKIDYVFDADPASKDLIIPKNIIQPLVENSIKHGILLRDYPGDHLCGKIYVHVFKEENRIHILVQDNGTGMPQETYDAYFSAEAMKNRHMDKDAEHIGILNVLMRLDYLYRKEYDIKVINHFGSGLCIELILPESSDYS